MSTNQEKENLEEKVLINENEESTEIVVKETEPKAVKAKKIGKTILKVAGVAGVGVLGYILGAKLSKNSSNNEEEPEIIEAEVIDE